MSVRAGSVVRARVLGDDRVAASGRGGWVTPSPVREQARLGALELFFAEEAPLFELRQRLKMRDAIGAGELVRRTRSSGSTSCGLAQIIASSVF